MSEQDSILATAVWNAAVKGMTELEGELEIACHRIAALKAERDASVKALREICFTSPSVESGMSFREWAKGIASGVLMGGGGVEPGEKAPCSISRQQPDSPKCGAVESSSPAGNSVLNKPSSDK